MGLRAARSPPPSPPGRVRSRHHPAALLFLGRVPATPPLPSHLVIVPRVRPRPRRQEPRQQGQVHLKHGRAQFGSGRHGGQVPPRARSAQFVDQAVLPRLARLHERAPAQGVDRVDVRVGGQELVDDGGMALGGR